VWASILLPSPAHLKTFKLIYFSFFFKVPLFAGQRVDVDPERIKEVHEILFTIDEYYFPNGNEWIAGENITAADFAYIATLSTIVVSISHSQVTISFCNLLFFLFSRDLDCHSRSTHVSICGMSAARKSCRSL
jgi:hypothetical protein